MTLAVLPAAEADIAPLLAACDSARRAPGCMWSQDYPDAEILREDIALGGLYKIEADGALAGLIGMGALGELDELRWPGGGTNPCEIARFGIARELQGRGVGAAALRAALALAKEKGFDRARLLVSPENRAALALYLRAGFSAVGEADMWGHHYVMQEIAL